MQSAYTAHADEAASLHICAADGQNLTSLGRQEKKDCYGWCWWNVEAAFFLRSRVSTQMHLTNECNVIFFSFSYRFKRLRVSLENRSTEWWKVCGSSLPSFVCLWLVGCVWFHMDTRNAPPTNGKVSRLFQWIISPWYCIVAPENCCCNHNYWSCGLYLQYTYREHTYNAPTTVWLLVYI